MVENEVGWACVEMASLLVCNLNSGPGLPECISMHGGLEARLEVLAYLIVLLP